MPVTVCVAAICRGLSSNTKLSIIGAADRMMTAGDIQYEPPQPKIIEINHEIVIMTSGDSTIQIEIVQDVIAEVKAKEKDNPKPVVSVRDVAYMYSRYYELLRFREAERVILAPLGLDGDSFITRQPEMSPDFTQRITAELRAYQFEERSEAIVAGTDNTEAHIWRIIDSIPRCHDHVGFAAIGAGAWHAESQFMFAGYTKEWLWPDASYLLYTAKKRAEVAPGVGAMTDMVIIGPTRRNELLKQGESFINLHESIYQQVRNSQAKLEELGKEILRVNAEKANEKAKAKAKAKQESKRALKAGGEPANETDVRDGVDEGESKSGSGESAPD